MVGGGDGPGESECFRPEFSGDDSRQPFQQVSTGQRILTPLLLKIYPGANLFRDDAVGINFEHIFNGAKEQRGISIFTPRRDPCELKKLGDGRIQIRWPSERSKWGMEARMLYDLSNVVCIDLDFECSPTIFIRRDPSR